MARGQPAPQAAEPKIDRIRGVPAHERHFYAVTRAFGRFGMRVFEPTLMEAPHWHGHVEANFILGGSMVYDVDGAPVAVPEGRLLLFWAGVPHQLTELAPSDTAPMRLTNLYLPVDGFLHMNHVGQLQVRLLGGAMALLPADLAGPEVIARWYADYRSNDFERVEILKMELNALLRRALVGRVEWLRDPVADPGEGRVLSSGRVRHVVEMVRYILENLGEPMSNADVAGVTGLHQNYAMGLFSQTMRLPMKRFIIRMRMLRARAQLLESAAPVAAVAEASGIPSVSQFYAHFRAAYGMSPHALRSQYRDMALR